MKIKELRFMLSDAKNDAEEVVKEILQYCRKDKFINEYDTPDHLVTLKLVVGEGEEDD